MVDGKAEARFVNPEKQQHYEEAVEELDLVRKSIDSDDLEADKSHRIKADIHIDAMDRIQKH